tara:strand:- start:176 stop:421 length:246 start_codon:yes stop_codon:yes gene_type:complete
MANTTGIKYGGRIKGTPNRLTKDMRTVLKNILFNELGNIEEIMDSLDSKQRIELVIKLLPFVLPKVETVSHTYNEPVDFSF